MEERIPSEIENVADGLRVGKVLDLWGVEEDCKVWVFLMGIVPACVVAFVDQLDLFDIFLLGFIEVSASRIDDQAKSTGLGHRNRSGV